jgi:four helix bundle protein
MAFKFEKLQVWKLALDLSNQVDLLTKSFPKSEMFNLSNQIKRAADSVVLNIAEGSTGQSALEYKRFLSIALRSAVEVVACLFIARSRSYIDDKTFDSLYSSYKILSKMLTKLRASVSSKIE